MQVHRIANCSLCAKPVDPHGCWRGSLWTPDLAHALCLAAFFLMDDAGAQSDRDIINVVNERADEFCELLCENPAHAVAPPAEN